MTAVPGPRAGRQATLIISRESLGFAAAHFSIIEGRSERLHGHNYRVRLAARGAVRRDGTVVDFAALKGGLRRLCDELDHRMLLPTESDAVLTRALDGGDVEVREGRRRFLFPGDDVRLLPIPNTTCECLAAHLLERLRAELGATPVRLGLTVEESPGQGATVTE